MAKKDDLVAEALRLGLIKNKTEGKGMLLADLEQMVERVTIAEPLAELDAREAARAIEPLAMPGMEGVLFDPADPLVAPVNGHCASCGETDVPLDLAVSGPRAGQKLCGSCLHGEPIDAAAELIHERVGGPEYPDRGNLRMPALDIAERIAELESKLAALRGQPNTRKERIALNRGIRRLEARAEG